MVRINQLPKGIDDLKYIVPNNVNVILVPKCESAEQIYQLEKGIEKLKNNSKLKIQSTLCRLLKAHLV